LSDRDPFHRPGAKPGIDSNPVGSRVIDVAARVFRLGGQWYFSTRDGDIGPFRTREQAKREAEAHHIVLKTR